MDFEFAMDDFSNVDPGSDPSKLTKPSKPNNMYQSPTKQIIHKQDYQKVNFKDIFDTDTSASASASASDTEIGKSIYSNKSQNNTISFSDLVVQERAKLGSKLRQNTSLVRFNSSQKKFSTFTNSPSSAPKSPTLTRICSPKRILRRSPSTIDALCGENASAINEIENQENDVSITSSSDLDVSPNKSTKTITTPTRYIHMCKRITRSSNLTKKLSDNGNVWVLANNNNYVSFNKRLLFNKLKKSKRASAKRLLEMESKLLSMANKLYSFDNNSKPHKTCDKNTAVDECSTCKSCSQYMSKIRTLEADLAIEKQHLEEMCRTNSQVQQKLDNSLETIGKLTKQHNHKLGVKELQIQQLNDRNKELLKRIELNINDIDYFKNCLLVNHNSLETLQSKLNELSNENSDLLLCVDRFKAENEKLANECSYYKKQYISLKDKVANHLAIALPQTQSIQSTITHIESIAPIHTLPETVSTDTLTDEVVACKDIEIKLPNLVNMSGFEKNIFPLSMSNNSAASSTDIDEQDSNYQPNYSKSGKNTGDKVNVNHFTDDLADKRIVNRTISDEKHQQAELKPLPPPLANESTEKTKTVVPYNPTTRWILDRVSRPSNLESLFKLQDRIRDMSLRM